MNDSSLQADTLSPDIAQQVRDYCQQGYQHYDEGDVSGAIRLFYSAWTRLPKPQTQWEQAGWVLTALGDAYFAKADYENGRHALLSALHCPKAEGNPFIHLRLGQCLFELGETEAAREQFQRVRDNAGEPLFRQEDPKYSALN